MGFVDLVWLSAILGGSGWLLWRFLWKNQGSCAGCRSGRTPPERRR